MLPTITQSLAHLKLALIKKTTGLRVRELIVLSLIALTGLTQTASIFGQWDGVESGEVLGTSPKLRTTQVTATVPDFQSPSTPILIAPENGELLSSGKVNFVWQPSADNVGVVTYQLWLNGSLKFDNIPTTSSDETLFALIYDTLNNQLTLEVKNNLSDGDYTWKVVALDLAGNEAESATWSFTIDSQSPTFVLTEIDGQSKTISVQDLATVPTNPIELSNNQPVLSGTGEGNSSVKLIIRSGSDVLDTINFTIGSDGTWSTTLPILPRDTIIYLDFEITDQVGNLSVLSDVPIILKTTIIVIPIIPIIPGIVETPIEIEIPTTPIPEQITQRFTTIRESLQERLAQFLPRSVVDLITIVNTQLEAIQTQFISYLWWGKLLAISWLIWPLILAFFWLSRPFGKSWSFSSGREVLRALGFFPGHPHSLVFDSQDQYGVPFVQVVISGYQENGLFKSITKVTNKQGIITAHGLTGGKFRSSVIGKGYHFPSLKKKDTWIQIVNFYQGQEIMINQNQPEPVMMIPVDPTKEKPRVNRFWLEIADLARLDGNLRWPHLAGCILIYIVFPSAWSVGSLVIYLLVMTKSLSKRFAQPNFSLQLLDNNRQLLEGVIIKVINSSTNELETFIRSDQTGQVSTRLGLSKHQLTVLKAGYFINQAQPESVSYEQTSNQWQRLSLSLKQLPTNKA